MKILRAISHLSTRMESGAAVRVENEEAVSESTGLESFYLNKQRVVPCAFPSEVCLPLRPVIVVVLSALSFVFKP